MNISIIILKTYIKVIDYYRYAELYLINTFRK